IGRLVLLRSPHIAGMESLAVTLGLSQTRVCGINVLTKSRTFFRPIGSFGSKTRFLRRESVRVLCSMMPAITLQLRVKCFLCVIQGMRVGHLTSQQGNWRKEIFPAVG